MTELRYWAARMPMLQVLLFLRLFLRLCMPPPRPWPVQAALACPQGHSCTVLCARGAWCAAWGASRTFLAGHIGGQILAPSGTGHELALFPSDSSSDSDTDAGSMTGSMAIDHDQIFRLLGRKNYDSGTWDLREAARLMLKQLEPYNAKAVTDEIVTGRPIEHLRLVHLLSWGKVLADHPDWTSAAGVVATKPSAIIAVGQQGADSPRAWRRHVAG